jgi:hypothetical protein
MVDINLIKDDEEKEWEPDSPGADEFIGEATKDEMKLDPDEKVPSFDDVNLGGNANESLLDDEESEDEQYGIKGNGKMKKSPMWLWLLLGLVLVAVALYLFVLEPRFSKSRKAAAAGPRKRADSTQVAGGNKAGVPPQDSGRTALTQPGSGRPTALPESGSISYFIESSKSIFEQLTRSGQFGAVLITASRFFVEYVSQTPNAGSQIGNQVQALLGASKFTASPEEKHRTAGKMFYWGVVSGDLPKSYQRDNSIVAKQFSSLDGFVEGLRTFVRQYPLNIRSVQKLPSGSDRGQKQTNVRIIIDGSKTNGLLFLKTLQGFQGNFALDKLLIAPATYSDFTADKMKIVLDFMVPFSTSG